MTRLCELIKQSEVIGITTDKYFIKETYRPITNERENVYSKFLVIKSTKKYFIFSSAC